MSRSRIVRVVVVLFGLLLLYVVGIEVREHYGIKVVVRNESGETLRRVTAKVETRGRTYNLGDLVPGERKSIFVEPVTESHIDVEFVDSKDKPHLKTVVGYAEAGYCGTASVTVLPGGNVESHETTELACEKGWFGFL